MINLASMPYYTPREGTLSTPREMRRKGRVQNDSMHESVSRLLTEARRVSANTNLPIQTDADLRVRMEVTPAVFSNWKNRGISKEGALSAEAKFGCSAHWILTGENEAPSEWPFGLLTPDDIARLPPDVLNNLEVFVASVLNLLEITGSRKADTNDNGAPVSGSGGFTSSHSPPDFVKADREGKRSTAKGTPRKTGNDRGSR